MRRYGCVNSLHSFSKSLNGGSVYFYMKKSQYQYSKSFFMAFSDLPLHLGTKKTVKKREKPIFIGTSWKIVPMKVFKCRRYSVPNNQFVLNHCGDIV